MSDVEDLLARTLRDPDRALAVPADPVRAIRARARRQRRTAALAAAAAVLVTGAVVAVPVALSGPDPAPVATDPAPIATDAVPVPDLPAGGLRWEPGGPLVGDAALVRAAAEAWRGVPVDGPAGPVRPVWAGRVGAARVVVLQAAGSDGAPLVAQVGDRDGRLSVLETEDVGDPDAAVLRLVDPASPRAGTVLLVRPGGAAVVLLGEGNGSNAGDDLDRDGSSDALSVDAAGLRSDERDLARQRIAVLGGDGRLVGDGVVPLRGVLTTSTDGVRLVAPRALAAPVRGPRAADYEDALRLAGDLPGTGPIAVAVIELDGMQLGTGRVGVPRFYELERDGRRWHASELFLGRTPTCSRLVEGPPPDAVLLRCPVPAARDGVLAVALRRGIELTRIRLGRFQSVQTPTPIENGVLISTGPDFPTGAGELRLADAAGTARPPVVVPPYLP